MVGIKQGLQCETEKLDENKRNKLDEKSVLLSNSISLARMKYQDLKPPGLFNL